MRDILVLSYLWFFWSCAHLCPLFLPTFHGFPLRPTWDFVVLYRTVS
ncbi:hypothetical protein AD37_2516 [Escherichia coli 1-110-08_S4_C3]|nr:hypothetical protein AD37_2516 [Escherichia coli 1-110-08_S4_C3]